MIIKNGAVFQEDGTFRKETLYIENHKLKASEEEITDKTEVDAEGLLVIPGLVDIHSHGAYGYDFSDGDPEGLKEILRYEKRSGITSYCPTSMTLPKDRLEKIFNSINDAGISEDMATVRGINMEGPFLDPKKKGAHVEALWNLSKSCMRKCAFLSDILLQITTAPQRLWSWGRII